MSRVAKAPIVFTDEVDFQFDEQMVTIKGPKGTLKHAYHRLVKICRDDSIKNQISFAPAAVHPDAWLQAGTLRATIANMIQGVTHGFEKVLELVGVGYRAQANGSALTLSLGFSHPILYQVPQGISVETPNNTTIILKGADKQRLGQTAAEIRSYRPPEPYKGKGIKYAGEIIQLKETKKK